MKNYMKQQFLSISLLTCMIASPLSVQASEEKAPIPAIEITAANFDQEVLHSTRPVILKVGAKWCPPCQMLAPVLDQIAAYFSDLKFASLDYDANPEFIEKHEITGVPTFMIYHKGKLVQTVVGCPPSQQALVDLIKAIDDRFKQN
jgi:thioredoxin 1